MWQEFVKIALKRVNFSIFGIEEGDGVEVVQIKLPKGNMYKIVIRKIDLDNQRSFKILKMI